MELQKLVGVVVIVIITLIFIGTDYMPNRIEIDNLELVYIVGLDVNSKGFLETTILRDKEIETNASQSGQSSQSNQTASASKETISVYSETLIQNKNTIATLTDKYITLSHAEYYLVGEELSKEGIKIVNDFVCHDPEGALDAKIYMIKGMSAKEFLNNLVSENINITEILNNNEKSLTSKNKTVSVSSVVLADMLLHQDKIGLIPYISIRDVETNSEQLNKTLEVEGAAIIYDAKVVGELKAEQVLEYNLAKGKIDNLKLTLSTDANEQNYTNVVSFGIDSIDVKTDFEFRQENLDKIQVNITCLAKLEEQHVEKNITNLDNVSRFQEKIEQELENMVNAIYDVQKNMKVDFMNLENSIYISHPYKYMKNCEKIKQQMHQVPIEVNVKCTLETTYDMLNTNIDQKENKEK